MYLLYTDESGDIANPSDDAFVVGGVAVHEDAVRPFAGEINGTIGNFLSRAQRTAEIHGSPLRWGKGEWKSVTVAKRHALAKALLTIPGAWSHAGSSSEPRVYVVVVDRGFSQSPFETAYGELLHTFDEGLRSGRKTGDPHNGILVADRGKYEKTLQAWVELARARDRRPRQDERRLYALCETPFFVDSRSTRLMQMADLIAYSFYRGYQAGDWSWAQVLETALGRDHGQLLHLTKNQTCPCPACANAWPST